MDAAFPARNRQLLLQALPQMGLRRIAPQDRAFYFYADVGHLTNDSLSFCEALLRDTGVAVAPGPDFDPVDADIVRAPPRKAGWFAAITVGRYSFTSLTGAAFALRLSVGGQRHGST